MSTNIFVDNYGQDAEKMTMNVILNKIINGGRTNNEADEINSKKNKSSFLDFGNFFKNKNPIHDGDDTGTTELELDNEFLSRYALICRSEEIIKKSKR
jgi:hypothetical protein